MNAARTAAAAKLLQSFPTLRLHRRQPSSLLCPRNCLGKNTGMELPFPSPKQMNKGEQISELCRLYLSNYFQHRAIVHNKDLIVSKSGMSHFSGAIFGF